MAVVLPRLPPRALRQPQQLLRLRRPEQQHCPPRPRAARLPCSGLARRPRPPRSRRSRAGRPSARPPTLTAGRPAGPARPLAVLGKNLRSRSAPPKFPSPPQPPNCFCRLLQIWPRGSARSRWSATSFWTSCHFPVGSSEFQLNALHEIKELTCCCSPPSQLRHCVWA